MEERDFYQVLQVHRRASSEIISEAYWVLVRKALARRATDPSAIETLNQLNSAYATLVNQELRRSYDTALPPHRLDGWSGHGAADRVLPGRRGGRSGAETKDLYRILQVDAQADERVIAAAYACLRQQYREGLWNGEDNQKALDELAQAFSTLRDSEQRASYDEGLPRRPSEEGPLAEPQPPSAAGEAEALLDEPGRESGIAARPRGGIILRHLSSLLRLAMAAAATGARYCAVHLYRGGRWFLVAVVGPQARRLGTAVGRAIRSLLDRPRPERDSGGPCVDQAFERRLFLRGHTAVGSAPQPPREQHAGQQGAPLARLVVSSGPYAGCEFIVTSRPVSIGSDPACDVILDADGQEIEAVHARIWRRQERFMIHRLAEGGRLMVAGQPLVWAVLEDGDELLIGSHRLTFQIAEHPEASEDGAPEASGDERAGRPTAGDSDG